MLDKATLIECIPQAINEFEVQWPFARKRGKVREGFLLPGRQRLLVTTDRLSAFDMVLAAVPFKGQVLNQLSAFWFAQTADIIPNHLQEVPDPNACLVRDCEPLSVEVIVRGYITGVTKTSLWTSYNDGERVIYGYTFPDGLKKNDPLPELIITPTTKAGPSEHDERLTCDEVVQRGFLDANTWDVVQSAALEIFRRGQEIARAVGFLLVDTKYEFGRAPDGTLMLIDEVHTPDSSRFWKANAYSEGNLEHWDKEYVRKWYAAQGYRGDGTPPTLPEAEIAEAAQRYIGIYEGLTGRTFEPAGYPATRRIKQLIESYATLVD